MNCTRELDCSALSHFSNCGSLISTPTYTQTEVADLLATERQEARAAAFKEQSDAIDRFRAAGCNLTLWCTPRAVVVQITFHDEDASPDVDKSFSSFAEAIDFALEAATTKTT